MDPINAVAERLGIDQQHLIPYGNTKAKVSLDAIRENVQRGKLVVVTGITPTPAGEGKTTTSIGLTEGLGRLGHKAVVNLREPALGPIFGIKGGGTGGGKARVVPEDEINIHFTGDAHAVGSTHNLLAALVENAVYRNQACDMAPEGVTWSRVTDASDRALRQITTGLGGNANSPLRETRFDFITASEIMAILALATDLEDLRARLSRMVVGTNRSGEPVSVEDLGLAGPLMAVMRHTVMPNLVQTMEGMPAIIHSGPFGNIAHGCSSIIADRLALGYADIIITEAGFASDLGFEKFMHIKTRNSGLPIAAAVLVSSVRAMRWHGGALRRNLAQPDLDAMKGGAANMVHHINIVRSFGLPVVVALNRFDGDSAEELQAAAEIAQQAGAYATAEYSGFTDGGEGGVALAEAVARAASAPAVAPGTIDYAYDLDASIEDKVLGPGPPRLRRRQRHLDRRSPPSRPVLHLPGLGQSAHLYGQDPPFHFPRSRSQGSPSGYVFPVSDIRASVGAGFLYTLAGRIETLPGLPTRPRAVDMDVSPDGEIVNL